MDLNNTESDEPDGNGSTATVLPITTARPTIRPVNTVPLAAAVAPLRARHHEAVSSAAQWSLEHGRPCALDVIALCIDVIEDHRTADGIRLDRPGVHGVLYGQVSNRANILDTRLPEDWHIHLWSAINWLHDDGRLSPDSDPLAALLEPLGCYGGLGTDGYPMPPGVDVDFPCQCHVAHDPTCPPGLALHVIGLDPCTYRDFIVRARLRLRGEDPTISCLRPLFELSRRLRERGSYFEVHADEFIYIGEIDADGEVPRLSLYIYEPTRRRWFDDLAVDDDGHIWAPKPDRRYKAGFHWTQVDDSRGLRRAGLSWAPSRDELRMAAISAEEAVPPAEIL